MHCCEPIYLKKKFVCAFSSNHLNLYQRFGPLFFSFFAMDFRQILLWAEKNAYLEKQCTKLDRKRVTNAFNGREAGSGTSCPLYHAHAKWFQVSHCDQERESGVKKEKIEIIWWEKCPKSTWKWCKLMLKASVITQANMSFHSATQKRGEVFALPGFFKCHIS